MKRHYIVSFGILLLLLTTTAQAQWAAIRGNGTVTKQERTVGNFSQVRVERGIDLYISQGEEERLTLEADENLLEHITTKVQGSTLLITHDKNFMRTKSLRAYLTVRAINRLDASGGSDVYSQSVLRAEKLSCNASGGSDLKLQLDVKDLRVTTSGGSDADLSGLVASLKATATGGSDIKAKDLRGDHIVVVVSGGSDAHVYADMELNASASGGSSIYYYGNPRKLTTSASGGGDIVKR
ncbi:head GIN domain-containing protein [Telluribacter sp.]|jgi:hypothetical protein|uniref:head GIN domain-containing protein n=1 Tax=Telluribacter sp. TaxID=1978767 RepID=UPI002E14C24E|nr:head GIN domain-containing protein [Telluribacter sp.]